MSGDARRGNGVLGAAVPRKEDLRLLTGRGRYVSDLVMPGMLHAAFVRSPFAHADVTGVDGAAALARPGVAAVVAGDDPLVIGVRITARSELPGYVETSQPVLAWPKVRFAGEAVAVLVAADRATATDAAELVEVDYEPRPVVVDPLAALDAGAPGGGGNGQAPAPSSTTPRPTTSTSAAASRPAIPTAHWPPPTSSSTGGTAPTARPASRSRPGRRWRRGTPPTAR